MSIDFPGLGKTALAYAKDLAERVFATAVQAFVAALVLTSPLDLDMWKSAALAGVAAGFAVVKGVIASFRGDKNSASLAKGV